MSVQVNQTTKKRRVGDGTPGPGRPKGSQNRVTSDVRQMVHKALNEAGGVEYLLIQSRENPVAFLSLVGKIIPKEVSLPTDVAGFSLVINRSK